MLILWLAKKWLRKALKKEDKLTYRSKKILEKKKKKKTRKNNNNNNRLRIVKLKPLLSNRPRKA